MLKLSDISEYRSLEPEVSLVQEEKPIVQQPLPAASARETVIVMQPRSATNQETGPRPWSTGLCGCFSDFSSCCLVTWCFFFYEMYLWGHMGENCCGPCCIVYPSAAYLRVKLRSQENIQGSVLGDHCTTCCCYSCVLCQLAREYDNIQRKAYAAPPVQPAEQIIIR